MKYYLVLLRVLGCVYPAFVNSETYYKFSISTIVQILATTEISEERYLAQVKKITHPSG